MPRRILQSFCDDESGATAIEYGILAALLSIVVIGAVTTTGQLLYSKFTNVNTALK